MTAFVYEDEDYAFPRSATGSRACSAIRRWPLSAALLSLRRHHRGASCPADRNSRKRRPADRRRAILSRWRPGHRGARRVQALGDHTAPHGFGAGSDSPSGPNAERMYAIDAGGQQTYLTSRYFDEHAAEFNSMKVDLYAPPGQASGSQPSYVAETVPLGVGNATVELHYIRVLTSLSAPPLSTMCMAFSASTLSASSRATRSTTERCGLRL